MAGTACHVRLVTLVELRYQVAPSANAAMLGNSARSTLPSAPTNEDVGHSSNVIITTDGALTTEPSCAARTSRGNTSGDTDELKTNSAMNATGAGDVYRSHVRAVSDFAYAVAHTATTTAASATTAMTGVRMCFASCTPNNTARITRKVPCTIRRATSDTRPTANSRSHNPSGGTKPTTSANNTIWRVRASW